ncbi:MAG: lipid-A-disaccharide synthase [Candidatus Goldiibacteriota bacterium HGW-Goldbacteria-1]|nr:MAG: lipid-A-disaccharide synthase [Candidatus Goldiibacteriota bacterium HGW-Goldbacteria-1]
MKILISAGEASGDNYGALLARALKKKNRGANIIGFGGRAMAASGVDVKIELTKFALVGFIEVVKKLKSIIGVYNRALEIIKLEKPDALVVIDYPGFHLKLIKDARALGVKKIVYYITPQVWVWKYKRIFKIKKYTDLCVVVYPFEEKIFAKEGINVRYFGHPLKEMIPAVKKTKNKSGKVYNVGIFPGSRENEIKQFIGPILEACSLTEQKVKRVKFTVFLASEADREFIQGRLSGYKGLVIEYKDGKDYAARAALDAAIAKSGTTTLELAMMGIPMAVVYRVNSLTFMMIKPMLTAKYAALPNIIAEKELVREFLQHNFKPEPVAEEIIRIITDKKYSVSIKASLKKAVGSLDTNHKPSNKTAAAILGLLK